jgi:putative inorganic carbon (hco3(-)) transporter
MTVFLLTAYLIGLAALSIKRPWWALGVMLALLPAYQIRFEVLSIPTTLLEVSIVVFLLFCAPKALKNVSRIKDLGALNILIVAFLLSGAVSTVISPDLFRALGHYKAFLVEPVLLFYAVYLLGGKENLAIPLKFLFASASAVSVFGIIQYATLLFLPLRFWGNGEEVRRITSVFEHPNALALFLAPLIVLFLALRVYNQRVVSEKIFWLGLLAQTAALVMTFSRGGLFAALIVSFFLIIPKLRLKRAALIAVLGIIVLFAIGPLKQRVITIANDPSVSARLKLVSAGFKTISEEPLLGNGLFGFRTSLVKQGFPEEVHNYPHNIILSLWLELGILGMASFLMIVLFSFKKMRNGSVLAIAAGAFFLTVLIHGLVDTPYFKNDLALMFWFVMGMVYQRA